ncbi:hypothetical protein JCM5296_001656 [Sporobolomyces johnsonii]
MKRTASTAAKASSSAPKRARAGRAAQAGPAKQAAAPLFDLTKLSLKRHKYELSPDERAELELSEDEDYDPEVDEECAWMRARRPPDFSPIFQLIMNAWQTVRYDIVGPKNEIFGNLNIWFIDIEEIRDSFYGEMDVPSHECMEFGFALFDANGYLKRRFRKEGTGAWGPEVDHHVLVYLQEIKIDKNHRGKGIGSWALQAIWHSKEELLSEIEFLFTWPAALTSELTDYHRTFGPWSEEGNALAQKEREGALAKIYPFFLKAGFRRVGTTQYSCYARDPSHRSKKIPADKDAEHVIPKTKHERAVADAENSQAFETMMGQWGH